MKVLSLFSGIGAFEKALKNLDMPFELVGYCEIDKYASKSYSAIHDVPETMNLGDITKIDETALPKDIDLITYGFPCQDISLAGKQKGLFNDDGTQTRSGLFFEALRIIEETQPKIAIAENVKNLVGKKFNAQFQVVLASLEAAGYNNYWQVLNAKDYGIPQNRERVFIVSIRKDIDTGSFKFPEAFPLELRLKDMLEDEVDEKYYLGERTLNYFIENTKKQQAKGNGFKFSTTDGETIAKAITTRSGSRMDDNFIQEPLAYDEQNGYIRKDGTVGTLTTDGSSPKHNNRVVEPIAVWDGFNQRIRADSTVVGTLTTNCGADLKRNGQGIIENCYVSEKGVRYICSPKRGMATDINADIAQPLTAKGQANWTGSFVSPDIESLEKSSTIGSTEPTKINLKNGDAVYFDGKKFSSVEKTEQLLSAVTSGEFPPDTAYGKYLFQSSRFEDKPLEECSQTIKSTKVDCGVIHNLRIRKLTPKECFRLMGFSDEDFAKAEAVNSNTQLYKQAGNSIVVDVLARIFTQLMGGVEE